MKKNILYLFSLFLVGSSVNASDSSYHVDKLKLDVLSDHIVGCLWRGDIVPEKEIDDMLESLGSSRTASLQSSRASSDEKHENEKLGNFAVPLKGIENENSEIEEIQELFVEVATERHETQQEIQNLKSFLERIRAKEDNTNVSIVKKALKVVFAKY